MTANTLKLSRKNLIVNADDFGLTEEINNRIIESHQNGIVTSASLIPTGKAFDHAVKLINTNTNLGIGIHLALTKTSPVLQSRYIPTLVNHSGCFYKSWRRFGLKLLMNKIDLSEVGQEWEAQIKKVLDAGLHPTHLDSHQHIHIFPSLWKIIKQLAIKYNIPFRFPLESKFIGWASCNHFLKWCCINLLLIFTKRERNSKSVDHFLGLGFSERLNEKNLTKYLSSLKHGGTELMCHPGSSRQERDALVSPEITRLLHKLNVNLINYRSFHG